MNSHINQSIESTSDDNEPSHYSNLGVRSSTLRCKYCECTHLVSEVKTLVDPQNRSATVTFRCKSCHQLNIKNLTTTKMFTLRAEIVSEHSHLKQKTCENSSKIEALEAEIVRLKSFIEHLILQGKSREQPASTATRGTFYHRTHRAT